MPGLKTTFDVLVSQPLPPARQVLVAALDSPYSLIKTRALETLIGLRDAEVHREIVARLHGFDADSRRKVRESGARMTKALADALLSDDREMAGNACQAALWFRDYDLLDALAECLDNPVPHHAALAADTILALCRALYDELASPRDYHNRRDPQTIRQHAISTLERLVSRLKYHQRQEVVEAFLILVNRDNVTLQRILRDPDDEAYRTTISALKQCTHGGVMRLLLSCLADPNTPLSVLMAIVQRTDAKFIHNLLRQIEHGSSAPVLSNLARVNSIAWLVEDRSMLAGMDEVGQSAAMRLATATAIGEDTVIDVARYLLEEGKGAAKKTAVTAVCKIHSPDADELLIQAVSSEDPEVQAIAARELRPREIPDAVPMLLELLGSPHDKAKQTAYRCLSDLNARRYIAMFDSMDEETQLSMGEIVKAVDSRADKLICQELDSKSRNRRGRALRMVKVLRFAEDPNVEQRLLALAEDADHLTRAAAIEALADADSDPAAQALKKAAEDSSTSVQEAARRGLQSEQRVEDPLAAEALESPAERNAEEANTI